VGAHYRQLCAGLRESLVINTDDTGWRVEGSTAHLMVFVGVQSTDSLAAVIARDPDWAALPGVTR
jgi:hypothetical protein